MSHLYDTAQILAITKGTLVKASLNFMFNYHSDITESKIGLVQKLPIGKKTVLPILIIL